MSSGTLHLYIFCDSTFSAAERRRPSTTVGPTSRFVVSAPVRDVQPPDRVVLRLADRKEFSDLSSGHQSRLV